MTQVLRGEPLLVERRSGDWLLVRTAYDYAGWIGAEHLSRQAPVGWPPAGSGRDVLAEARAYLGAPYFWGGMTRRGIDCSGLVHMAFRKTGIIVPRDAHEQEAVGAPVEPDDVRPGDLVTYGAERAEHIAFWVGDQRILHATDRDGVHGVVEEREPGLLRERRRRIVRLPGRPAVDP